MTEKSNIIKENEAALDSKKLSAFKSIICQKNENMSIRSISEKYRKLFVSFLAVIFIIVTLISAYNVICKMSFDEILASLRETRFQQVTQAVFCTIISYVALIGYDFVALRKIGSKINCRVIALGAFTGFTTAFNLGFPLFTGSGVRYWVYSREEITAKQIAHLSFVNCITFWLGVSVASSISLLICAARLSEVDHIPIYMHIILGIMIALVTVMYFIWIVLDRRVIHILEHIIELPTPITTGAQIFVGVIEVSSAAAALFMLMPDEITLDYFSFIAIYLLACVAAVISHVPGGVGVFEATILQAFTSGSHEKILAALLVFRGLYYFIPFIAAIALLGFGEVRRRWSSICASIAI